MSSAYTMHGVDILPFETIASIFELSASEDLSTAIALSHVSRRWRNIALKCPILWDRIEMTKHVEMISTLLERSRSSLIDVVDIDQDGTANPTSYGNFFSVVAPHSYRWRSICIPHCPEESENEIRQLFQTLDTPYLERIIAPNVHIITFPNLLAIRDCDFNNQYALTQECLLASRPELFRSLTRLVCRTSLGTYLHPTQTKSTHTIE